MSNPFVENLKALLRENPEHCYVTDTFLAVFIGEPEEENVMVIAGDFGSKKPEELNQIIVDTINRLL